MKYAFLPLAAMVSACSLNNVGNTGSMPSVSDTQQVRVMEGNYVPPSATVSASRNRKDIFIQAISGMVHSAPEPEKPDTHLSVNSGRQAPVMTAHPVMPVKASPLPPPPISGKPAVYDLPEISGS